MNQRHANLLFPPVLKQVRSSRGLMQKSVAIDLGLDAAVLCGIEKGTRGPLDDRMLQKACELFKLTNDEIDQLQWAAHHDRIIGILDHRGASKSEVALLSASLHAWHHLGPEQRNGLVASLRQISQSARLVSSLTKPNQLMEMAMT